MSSVRKQFYDACQTGNIDLACKLFEKIQIGFQMINTLVTEYQMTIFENLHLKQIVDWNEAMKNACQGGNWDIIRLVFEHAKITNWSEVLNGACFGGHKYVIDWVIQNADKKKPLNWDCAMLEACRSGNIDIVRITIEHGATNWNQALGSACYHGHWDIIHLMIEQGANAWDDGYYCACRNGKMDVVHFMIEKGATDLRRGFSQLCQHGELEMIQKIIKNEGIDEDDWGYGLAMACRGKQEHIVRFIFKSHFVEKHQSYAATDAYSDAYFNGQNRYVSHMKTTEFLIRCGAGRFDYQPFCVPYLMDRGIEPQSHKEIVLSCRRERLMKQKIVKNVMNHVSSNHVLIDNVVSCFILPQISFKEIPLE